MSYSLLGLDEEPAAKKKAVAKAPSKYSALGLDDSTAPAPAPVSKVPNDTGASLVINPKTVNTKSLVSNIDFSKYNTAAQEGGKDSTSLLSKISGVLKSATGNIVKASEQFTNSVIIPAAKKTVSAYNDLSNKNEEEEFKLRQIMARSSTDPVRLEKDPITGKKVLTNNALEAYKTAKTPEEKANIISTDTKEIPIFKALNSEFGKKLTKSISEKTSNVPLKAYARLQTAGDKLYDIFSGTSGGDTYEQNLSNLETKANDPNNPRWQKILYGVQNSGVQSAIGALLSVGTAFLTKNPRAGSVVGTAYFSALSAEEERQKYQGGNIDSTKALGNIAIDTVGDQMISNLAEKALINFGKESSKVTLKSILEEGGKGFLVEGGTEPTQSMLKYANDYSKARTEEEKKAVVDAFSQYIKSGAMLDEFLIGGIAGAGINTIATGAGALTNPIVNKSGDEITPDEIEKIKADIHSDLKAAIENETTDEIVNIIEDKHDLPEAEAVKIVEDATQDIVAENANREAPAGSQEHQALKQDIQSMLENGESVSDISQKMQDMLNMSAEYSDSIVAESLNELQNKPSGEVAITEAKTNQEQKNIEQRTYSNEEVAQKLADAGVAIDAVEKLAKNLAVALNKTGTDAEIADSIAMLSNPKNESSRAIYEAETGTKLPATAAQARIVLEKALKPSTSREYANNVVSAELNGKKGYRGKNVSGETMPEYIPDEMRSKKMLDEVQPYVEKGVRPTDEKLAKLYDLIQSEIDSVEEKYKADEINLNQNDVSAESSSVPFDVAHAQITSESLITMGEAEEAVRKYFDSDEVPVSFVKNLRTPRGLEAWGKYSKQMITLIENPRVDTPHHEAVHAFLDLFVPEYERSRFLATAYQDQIKNLGQEKVNEKIKDLEDRYNGKLSREQVISVYSEEALADGFYEYLQGRNQKSPLAKFYDMVIAFVKSIKDEADSMRLYEEIISKKRYTEERMKESLKLARRITYAQEKGLDPSLFSIKNRIHPEDIAILKKFIDHARLKTELSDSEYKAAERLAEKWGISMDKGLAGVANEFTKVLENGKKVTSTILYSEKQDNAKQILQQEIKNFSSSDEFASKAKEISDKVEKYAGGDRARFNENISKEEQDLRAKILAYLQTPEVLKMYDAGKKDPEILKDFYEENTKEKSPASIVKSNTYATQPFKNLENKNKAFKSATIENTESHAINLGEEKINVEGAKIQKAKGEIDGLYTSPYTVIVQKNAKERVIFSAENEKEAIDWLKKNAGKSVSVDNNQTANVMVEGNEAHAIVTSPDIIPMETENIGGTTDASKITFYDTTGKKIATADVSKESADFEPIATVSQETPVKLETYKDATRDNSARASFPSYFAAINSKPVLITSDSVPLSQEKYTRAKKDQTSQNPIEPNLNEDAKIRKSGAFQNAKERLGENFQEDVNYTAIKIDDQISKAFNLLDADPEYAKAVALGFAQPPLDITDTAISIAVAERARESGDYALQAEAERARSLRQSRRGQELVLEKGYVDESSSHFFIDKIIKRRKELVEQKYKPILGKSTPFQEILHEKTSVAKKKAVKKLKEDLELKAEQLDSILEELAC